MTWNRSESVSVNGLPCRNAARNDGRAVMWLLRGVLIGLIVVIAVGACFLFFAKEKGVAACENASSYQKGRIAEVEAAVLKPKKAVEDVKDAPESVVDHPPTNRWGNPWHWGPNKKLKPKHIARPDRSQLPLYEQIFENSADRTIAGLLVIEPGDDLIGGDEPSPWFMRSFLQSLKTPIVISEDDSEEAAALKRAVIETRNELKARYDAGEDIVKLLTDTRCELRELGAYRDELKKMVADYRRKKDISSDDMKDMVEAANKMLEERGLKKIVMPEFYYNQIELRNKIRKEKGLSNNE